MSYFFVCVVTFFVCVVRFLFALSLLGHRKHGCHVIIYKLYILDVLFCSLSFNNMFSVETTLGNLYVQGNLAFAKVDFHFCWVD